MNISTTELRRVFLYVFVLVVSVAIHEFGHAFMADRLGDDTPRRQGRVTLNPLAHADPIGTLLLPILGGFYGGGSFGWGRPVLWTPSRIRRGISMSTASILVAIAGPTMNLLLGTVLAATRAMLLARGVIHEHMDATFSNLTDMSSILEFATLTNFILFFFNLVPVPPLDGGHVAESFTPYRYRDKFHEFARFGPFIVLGVMLIPQVQWIFVTPAMFCAEHVYNLFHSLF